jgi:hypothetical protein
MVNNSAMLSIYKYYVTLNMKKGEKSRREVGTDFIKRSQNAKSLKNIHSGKVTVVSFLQFCV